MNRLPALLGLPLLVVTIIGHCVKEEAQRTVDIGKSALQADHRLGDGTALALWPESKAESKALIAEGHLLS
jgi:hypothetical protein